MVERKLKYAPPMAEAEQLAETLGKPLHFEGAVQRLAEIVEELEAGELPLEESLKLFEEGIKLARTSQKVLDQAEARVEELLAVDHEGKPTTREIEPE